MTAAVEKGVKVHHIFVAANLLASFLAAQRYTMPELSVYMCLVPLLSALYYHNRSHSIRLTFTIWALFLSLDANLPGYPITAAPLRYLIYIYAFFLMASRASYSSRSLIVAAGVFFFYMALTLANDGHIDGEQFERDLVILSLSALVLLSRDKEDYFIDLNFIYIAIILYLISELINIFILNELWYGGYLSYNTTKFFVVFATFYALTHRSPLEVVTVIVLTVIVLIAYVTRAIILMYIASLLFYGFFISRRKLMAAVIVVFLAVTLIFLPVIMPQNVLGYFKSTNMINIILSSDNIFSLYKALDRVRYDEHILFFNQDLFSIIFGNGFGAAILDYNSIFYYIEDNNSAFSDEELSSRYFVGFHDMWIDVGVRFGLLPLIVFLYVIFRDIPKNSYQTVLYLVSVVGFISAFYSNAGLLVAFIFAQNYRLSRSTA